MKLIEYGPDIATELRRRRRARQEARKRMVAAVVAAVVIVTMMYDLHLFFTLLGAAVILATFWAIYKLVLTWL